MKAMKELHEARQTLEDECKNRRDEASKHRRLAVVSWLSPADSLSDHEDIFEIHQRDPENGLWLFQQPLVRDWVDPSSLSAPLLWINGKPGAGEFSRVASHFYQPNTQEKPF